jgi:hypothetical protein
MVRVIWHSPWGVYISREVGERHHGAHAHIKLRGQRIATVRLDTLDYMMGTEPVPKEIVEEIARRQEELIEKWIELNEQ